MQIVKLYWRLRVDVRLCKKAWLDTRFGSCCSERNIRGSSGVAIPSCIQAKKCKNRRDV